ncbi:MAG: sigma 54-interacting transcriptional regulator [Sandaracinaceae bacterium]|nr:sigma 54-interacting transcriptional regulator [Sandaracinaceae bacterium]
MERLRALADADEPVLLTGEASSGKGVFARILHDEGRRKDAPFVVLRCATLIDQERITAALGPRGGLGEDTRCEALAARGGTLVLDEICELLPDPQERLLDALDALEGPRGWWPRPTSICARLAERGAFSEALLEALAGAEVPIPALRERPEDIVPLAEVFAEASAGKPVKLSPGALARLRSYPWPGNVLELRNAMERAVRLATGGEIMAEHLPSDSLPVASGEGRLREHVDSIERDAIIKAPGGGQPQPDARGPAPRRLEAGADLQDGEVRAQAAARQRAALASWPRPAGSSRRNRKRRLAGVGGDRQAEPPSCPEALRGPCQRCSQRSRGDRGLPPFRT